MKIGMISGEDARWLGNAAAVAGGWVMVDDTGAELAARLDPWHESYLAALPDHFSTVVRPVEPRKLLSMMAAILERDANRTYLLRTKAADVARGQIWAARLASAIGTLPEAATTAPIETL